MVVGREGAYALPNSPRLRREPTAVVDLSVGEPNNFFAGGLLVHKKPGHPFALPVRRVFTVCCIDLAHSGQENSNPRS